MLECGQANTAMACHLKALGFPSTELFGQQVSPQLSYLLGPPTEGLALRDAEELRGLPKGGQKEAPAPRERLTP